MTTFFIQWYANHPANKISVINFDLILQLNYTYLWSPAHIQGKHELECAKDI